MRRFAPGPPPPRRAPRPRLPAGQLHAQEPDRLCAAIRRAVTVQQIAHGLVRDSDLRDEEVALGVVLALREVDETSALAVLTPWLISEASDQSEVLPARWTNHPRKCEN